MQLGENIEIFVILTTVFMKIHILQITASSQVKNSCLHFGGSWCFQLQGLLGQLILKMWALRSSKSATTNQKTRWNVKQVFNHHLEKGSECFLEIQACKIAQKIVWSFQF
jgi:hypothetical protein